MERRALALTAGLAEHDKDGHVFGLVDQMRSEFDAALVSDPAPETEAVRLRRELGI